jgi:FtsZ-binding cell division protein ZapB
MDNPATVEEAMALLEAERQKTKTAAEMGQMLLAKCETITKESAETQAAMQAEIKQLKEDNTANATKVNDLGAKNEHLQSQNEEYAKIVREMEAENEGLLDEAGSKEVSSYE